MPIGLLFWMLMILVLFFGGGIGYWGWGGQRGPFYSWLLLWFLLFLLGWHDFGFILQGGGIGR
jgi:hypothetical protein